MKNYSLIENFFHDKYEYLHFSSNLRELVKANDNGTCFGEISKVENYYLYKLTWLPNGKFIGDYIKPFEATEENIQIFNSGSKIIAERLCLFIENNNPNLILKNPPAFGNLTHKIDVEIKFDYSNGAEPFRDRYWKNKETGELELIRIPLRPMRESAVINYHEPNITRGQMF